MQFLLATDKYTFISYALKYVFEHILKSSALCINPERMVYEDETGHLVVKSIVAYVMLVCKVMHQCETFAAL